MNREPVRLKKVDLFKLDLFFKEQYVGRSRYGTMGSFYWKIFMNHNRDGYVNLITDNSKIAATTSITPKSLFLNNELLPSAEIGDTYTHQDYRGKGLFSILINQSREEANDMGVKFVFGTPNNQSLPGYRKRANFDVVESLDVRALRFQLSASNVLRPKVGWFFANLVNLGYGVLIRLYNLWLNLKTFSTQSIYIEERVDLPLDWDDFWMKASSDWDFIFNKDSASMLWRYVQNPEKYSFIFLRSNDKLVGFCVYRLISDETGTNLVVADFLFLKEHSAALANCIKYIKSKGLELGVNSINLWCESKSPYFKEFRRNGFMVSSSIPVITHKDDLFEQLKSVKKSHFVMADSDNI